MTTKRTTAPLIEPVTLQEAKDHLRVDHDDEDTLIGGLIAAAVAHFDGSGVLGRAMITQTWAQWVPQSPAWVHWGDVLACGASNPVRLNVGPFQSLVSVEYYDTENALQTADLADFEIRLDGDFVTVQPKKNSVWPPAYLRQDAIKISYTAGYGDTAAEVPASVRHAILLTLAHWYEHREAVVQGSYNELPLAVSSLIGVERVGWYG